MAPHENFANTSAEGFAGPFLAGASRARRKTHMTWPSTTAELTVVQREIGALSPAPWTPEHALLLIGGCFVCFPRQVAGAGAPGDPAWAAAVVMRDGKLEARALIEGFAGAGYEPGLLALREGALLEAAVRALPLLPDVLLVNATGLDHPRGCGLALHLGRVLSLPTIGVTHRPLLASGSWPDDVVGETSPLTLNGHRIGYWLRTKPGSRPLAVHAAWRTSAEVAVDIVQRALSGSRTPEPLRQAREMARSARATSP
jgi:deoxyribonuclease V